MQIVNLAQKFASFSETWSPKILAQMNGVQIKAVKVEGAFVWHRHDETDEVFVVTKGRLVIRLRDREVALCAGELIVVPKGVEHQPVAEEPCEILLIEPAGTLNTGAEGGTEGAWI